MKVAVCVKHAVDETELQVDQSGKPMMNGAASKMSVFDKNAVEEALRLRSAQSGEVAAYTVGQGEARKSLKEALAMGADRGVLVSGDTSKIDSLKAAELLSAAMKKNGLPDLVVCSEGSSDTYSGQVPPMLAEFLGFCYVGYVRKIEVADITAKLERSLEDTVESVEAPLPLVISVVSEINEPRYPTLIQIMQASKKPIEELESIQLAGPSAASAPTVVSMSVQSSSRKHIMLQGSAEEVASKLVEAFLKEGVISR